MLKILLLSLQVGLMVGQDVAFIDDDAPKPECMTVSGPKPGVPCQLPFRFQGKLRTACLKEEDQEDKFWCSTLVDDERNHVPNQENWGYCSDSCPTDSTGTKVPEGRNIELTNDIEGSPCTTLTGELGVCHLPSSCVGVTISFLETNECVLKDSTTGVCCLDITENNIVDIVDTAADVVDIPQISVEEAEDFLRSGFFEVNDDDVEANVLLDADGVNFGFEDSPAEDPEDTGPTEFHLRFNTPRKDIISVDKDAQVLLEATKQIQESNNLTDEQAGLGLRSGFNSGTSTAIDARCPWTPAPTCNPNLVYRTFDGTCNNLKEPNFGRTGTPFQRILLPEYAQGTVDIPRKRANSNFELPSSREVSNGLAGVSNQKDSDNTVLVMQMGQFIDHDITHTPNHGIQCCANNGQFPSSFDPTKCFPIRMFDSDPFWRGKKTCMNFARSLSSPGLKCELQAREQLNQITHWMDGSNIYGSTTEDAMYLRGPGGKLKFSPQDGTRFGSLPSCKAEPSGKVTGCDVCGGRKNDCFFAGDFRVNEQLNLIVIHTLFMREHNRLAGQLQLMNPGWSEDKIYQEARRITVAEFQHIVYKEWLPIIIGNTFMKSYGLFPLSSGHSFDYADNFDPRINNEFATAAFRFGHSMIPGTFSAKNKGRSETVLNLSEIFFKPKEMSTAGFLDSMVRGMTDEGSSLWDSNFIPDIKDHLFESRPGSGGLDLVAVNIQRGRDHGIPGYNRYREICVGAKANSWEDLRSSLDEVQIEKLRRIYTSVDDIDLYVGGFLEKAHEDSILGPVFKCIIGDQFARLKKGDRFFYDLGLDKRTAFTPAQLDSIRKTSMSRIICDNTDDIDRIQPLAFKLPTDRVNKIESCAGDAIPRVNLEVFRETGFGR